VKSTTAPAHPVGCSAGSLKVAVLRGSGVAGHQYATVVFTNSSATACPLVGFPGIELLVGGTPIGKSVRSGAAAPTITLAPGASANADLVNDSTCGADTSDSVQVIAPNTTGKTVLPLAFRGCTVTVGPVHHA
jgi:hypothetical protein